MEDIEMIKFWIGTSITGFLFLAGWMFWIARNIPDAKRIASDLGEIKTALIGTMTKQGIISKIYNIEDDVDKLKKKVYVEP